MNKNLKKMLNIIALMFVSFSIPVFAQEQTTINGTYKIVVNGYDWGPSVSSAIVSLDNKINAIDPKDIFVVETKKWYPKKPNEGFSNSDFNRTIINAYLCDEKGNKVKGASKYFVLDFKVSPNEGSPFLYDFMVTQQNNWADPYYLTISLAEGKSLVSGKNKINKLNIDTKLTEKIMPEVSKFESSKYTDDNIALNYAYYTPKKDSGKNPLVIWLHGMGEGGTDTSVTLLGNKITALVSDETQKMLGNAYVLAPEAQTFWMDNGSGNIDKFDGTSKYDKVLISLIKNFVENHPDIDKTKIIIGGCSNGGFMTLRTVALNPNYFSAAYPICEPYTDKLLSDDMINSLKNVPIWFTLAINDPVVPPMINELPTFARLVKAGAKDVHMSLFSSVKDTSGLYKNDKGEPYEYNGHWSWIYTLNNKCVEGDLKLFEWAASKVNNNNK